MYEYIKGSIAETGPTHIVLDINGVGYQVQISLYTYSQLENKTEAKLYIHENIREDAFVLYGFADPLERDS